MNVAAHPTIALLQSNSLTMAVQQEVERAILAGEYSAGAKLNEAALALKLGVSRGPVREAFRMLDEAGLVRSEKNRGVFVRDIPIDEAIEIFELRAGMEELVGKRLAQTMTSAQQDEIELLVHDMEGAVASNDAHRYHLLNLQFHDRLVEMAGNRKLATIYRRLVKEIALFRRINLSDAAGLPASAQEHWEILKAIRSGVPDAAGRAMFDHTTHSMLRMVENHQRRGVSPPPSH